MAETFGLTGIGTGIGTGAGVSGCGFTGCGLTGCGFGCGFTGCGLGATGLAGVTGAVGLCPPLMEPWGMGSTDPAETPIPIPGLNISRRASSGT